MTPMIDIVFLLLVFFVCVASDQVAEMTLPTELAAGSVDAKQVEDQESWTTEIRLRIFILPEQEQASIEMNGRVFNDYAQFQTTLTALADISRDSPVILDIADDVELRDVVSVYDACRASEFESIHFAMHKKTNKKNGSSG
ncbi:MAG: biopolymer transporter ExbD [Planctomycetaceae bacterium]|nr:biopolymer transporter ExbD [Planctomycetaceae bacterium]